MTASRTFGVFYTNQTGKPLQVLVTMKHTGYQPGDGSVGIPSVNSVNLMWTGFINLQQTSALGISFYNTASFFVPIGSTYRVDRLLTLTGACAIQGWWEQW